jgi:hypothetical protein
VLGISILSFSAISILDLALIVTPEQNVDRDDNTTGKKKKR